MTGADSNTEESTDKTNWFAVLVVSLALIAVTGLFWVLGAPSTEENFDTLLQECRTVTTESGEQSLNCAALAPVTFD